MVETAGVMRPIYMPIRITIPARLVPYLADMTLSGWWGSSLQKTVVRAVERQIQLEVASGSIPLRLNGKPQRRPSRA